MKLRKLLSTFLSVAMISTLVSAFSVAHAADAPTFTATAAYDEEFEMIAVTVTSSGLDSLAANSGNALKPTITGISTLSLSVECDNADLAFYAGLSNYDVVTPSAVQPTIAVNISKATQLITDNPAELVTFYFEGSKDAVANFSVVEPNIRVKAYNAGKLASTTDYIGEQVTCVPAAFNAEVEVPEVPSVDVVTGVTSKDAINNPNGEKTWGVKAVATPANGGTFTKVIANLNNGSADAAVTVYEGTAIEAATTFGLNIMQVPADVIITAIVAAE